MCCFLCCECAEMGIFFFVKCHFWGIQFRVIWGDPLFADTLPETNRTSPLKMDGWNTILSYWGFGLFSGAFAVSFREQVIGFLRVPGVSKGRVFLGNPKDSVWEDWGTLGNIREPLPLDTPPLTTL